MNQRPVPLQDLPAFEKPDEGLSSAQVEAQRAHGFNDIVVSAASGWKVVLRDTLRDPMLWFLLGTAGLFATLGQISEALTLLVAIVPLSGMDAYLHRRTSASSASLASRLASSARVLRDGRWQDIPAREVVPGDLVEVPPGEYFPADGLLVAGEGLQVDESTLPGESLPVAKLALPASPSLPAIAAESHWGSAGTRLLTSTARLRVAHIGAETHYGEIARSATLDQQAATPLQKAIGELVLVLLFVALAVCLLLAGVRLWQGHGWIDALLSAVTLAVAALPEEFPVVYTFFLGVGVFRLARKKALVRRAVAVENIGRITCIVSDKTGTLTAGVLVLAHRTPAAGLTEDELLAVAANAARADSGDPLDQALHAAADAPSPAGPLAAFPFTEARRRETLVWQADDGRAIACTKGAPETVLALCPLTPEECAKWLAQVDAFAAGAHKVIACAWRDLPAGTDLSHEPTQGFRFAGLLAFEDPVREGVREAIASCLAASMRVVMCTGDHPRTAAAVAKDIGLGNGDPQVLSLGPEADLAAAVARAERIDGVARATPAQKVALVQALQARGERVAVTGDGVNDVPALKQADVGVAMGERGTRSAREVAPVVLLDDNFRTLVEAIAEGRQLFQNLRLAFAYLLLVHLPLVAGAALIPMLGLPLLFLPIHIVWLELVIHPTAMLAFQDLPPQAPLAAVQRHAPRARFFSTRAWLGIAALGAGASAALVWAYLHALGPAADAPHARAMALSLLMAASAAFTLGLTRLRRPAARALVLGTLLSTALFVQWPALSGALGLRPLHLSDWALIGMVALVAAAASRLLARWLDTP
jgi:Ca2+-transporting ATPase